MFEDGEFYRAMCLEVSSSKAKLLFVDYGSKHIARFENIMKIPKLLVENEFSITPVNLVDVKLSSGRSISSIDIEETREVLMLTDQFPAYVQKFEKTGSFLIVIPDSEVVF
jgi:Tudor domain